MHFAYPPRKNSNPPPFRPRSARLPLLRRSRLRMIALVCLACVAAAYFLFGPSKPSSYHERVPSGSPPVVLVTVINPTTWDNAYLKTVRENRETYAAKHGYEAMVVKAFDYDSHGAPPSWTKIVAMRHALSKYPDCKFIWYLDQNAFIMDPNKSLEALVLETKTLEGLMIKDYPVVPPDSIIKTFSHLRGQDADFIVSQDKDSLVHSSVILRNGEWSKFFLETWYDPLYRSYNFQKAERHALEHIVQWHPTILSKLALVPQRTFAAYSKAELGDAYQKGDFVIIFPDCKQTGPHSCEAESKRYLSDWRGALGLR
ncbi:galactosyl transferase GMA12/MNN10 family protein [Hirsutella rhossiliensis]|uniref:Galactosyl transferase GMA12/MNN10 family domain-containing protein n=1 Tax=Hirsutella rhossiliensis TaxID=111463 RepID=A0A9P8SNB9_9HYPO|nr:galactosyl transferase GMA12/MNN10 family domain-containing protein [Hirsutella rhossiliensis]KAH0968224.1 galactosyl transferase GMA12/MNN10 family domain-containing protein [Hirsutella rhossiliensis]